MIKIRQLLFVVCMICLCNAATAQNITINKTNVAVGDLLEEISKQSGCNFNFSNQLLDVEKKISFAVAEAPLKSALTKLFEGTSVDFEIEGKSVDLFKKAPKATPAKESQKTHTVTGVVKDETGAVVIGATVFVKGSNNGCSTDLNGAYSLQGVNSADVIEVSCIGYDNMEIAVGTKTKLDITMKSTATNLEEVVVVGYGAMKRKDITTAVSSVSVSDIDERPVVSAAQAIAGKAAGVQVTQPSGAPGAALSIRVRGATSVQASNEPLYVVDGVPMDDISNLSPNDIADMQILKDASSASIYGARAANGVVLISTKRGAPGQAIVKVGMYAGVSQLGNKIDALNTEQYKDLMTELSSVTTTVPSIPESETRYTNWTDEFFKTGVEQNYQISLQNGNEKLQYYISAGITDQTGIVQKAGYNRYNIRANVDSQHSDWLKIGLSTAYTHSKVNSVYESRSAMRAGSILSVINTPPFMQVWDPANPKQYDEIAYGSRIMNPIAANATDQISDNDRLILALNLDFQLFKNLKFRTSLSTDNSNSDSSRYLDPITTNDGRATKGFIAESYSRNDDYLMENILTYDNTIGDHSFSAMAGSTVEYAYAKWLNVGGFDFLSSYPNITGIAGANQIKTDETNGGETAWSLASFLGRVTYNYKSRYLATFNMRADGSSRFAPGHRWGYFPSASAGWRISAEPFMEDASSWLDDLKLRAGWGINGNQGGIGNFSYLAEYGSSRNAPTTDNLYPGYSLTPYSAANPDLTWEKTEQYNIGVDASFFGSRLTFAADFYHKKTTDLLLTVSLPTSVNLPGGITRNDGEMLNRGMEFMVNSVNIKSQDLTWTTNFNISFNENKVEKLGLNKTYYYAGMYTTGQNAIIVTEGVPLGSFFGYISEGVDPETGDLIYKDVDENGVINSGDRTVIGCAQPKFVAGMTNTLNYKGLGFSFFLQGSYGNDIFNASKIDMEQMLDFRNQSTTVLRRWQRPGQITDIPRVGNIDNINNSTRFVEDGSYLRVKSITLSYEFQSAFLKKCHLSRLQPYVTANNLFTLTKYSGYDPEVNAYGASGVALGVDYGTYPQSRTLIFGVNVEF